MLVTTLGEQEVSNSIAVAANSLVFFMFFIISYIREDDERESKAIFTILLLLTHSHSFYLVYLYFLGDSFRFITQRIQIGVQRCIAKYDSHATVDAGKRLAEDAQISVFFFRHFFHATILRTFLTRYRRKDNGTCTDPLLLDAGDGQAEYGTQVKFELIQILRSCTILGLHNIFTVIVIAAGTNPMRKLRFVALRAN